MRAVLTFHSIDDSGSVLSFAPVRFAELVESLARSGVPVVAFDDLLQLREGIAITFDDGMATLHRHALPVLRAHGFMSNCTHESYHPERSLSTDARRSEC